LDKLARDLVERSLVELGFRIEVPIDQHPADPCFGRNVAEARRRETISRERPRCCRNECSAALRPFEELRPLITHFESFTPIC
jgi:hypothetical protein